MSTTRGRGRPPKPITRVDFDVTELSLERRFRRCLAMLAEMTLAARDLRDRGPVPAWMVDSSIIEDLLKLFDTIESRHKDHFFIDGENLPYQKIVELYFIVMEHYKAESEGKECTTTLKFPWDSCLHPELDPLFLSDAGEQPIDEGQYTADQRLQNHYPDFGPLHTDKSRANVANGDPDDGPKKEACKRVAEYYKIPVNSVGKAINEYEQYKKDNDEKLANIEERFRQADRLTAETGVTHGVERELLEDSLRSTAKLEVPTSNGKTFSVFGGESDPSLRLAFLLVKALFCDVQDGEQKCKKVSKVMFDVIAGV